MKKNTSFINRSEKGFSLIEILIVIALIGTLAGILIANLDNVLGGGQEDVARLFVEQSLEAPLLRYKLQMNGYPTTEQGLKALLKAPANAGSRWKGPYIKEEAIDPWGQPYQYRSPGVHNPTTYDVWSWGPDKKEGGGDDIGNWK